MSDRGDVGAGGPARAPSGGRAAGRARAGRARALFERTVSILSSYALSIVLLFFLFVLTLLGTLEQANSSLYDVQRKYFESIVLVHDFGPVSIPLPGASVVLAVLALNLIVGGVVRIRKGSATIGILIGHLGILLLFGGSLLEFLVSEKGQLTLFEGQSSDEFRAYHEWEIAVKERLGGKLVTEFILPSDRLEGLDPSDVARFTSSRLPFEVEVTGWLRNSLPEASRQRGPDLVDGWRLKALDLEKEAERNLPGARVTLLMSGVQSASLAPVRGLVWGREASPWVVTYAGRRFEIGLRTRRWALPFRLELHKFVHEEHPGISMAREFSSYVTKIEDGVQRDVHITMNEPFRHRGYTFYQSGWGPSNAPPGEPLFSTFSVVRNPADRVPLIACLVIAAGLLWTFVRKLILHVRSQARARAALPGSPP